jgi:DNA-binding response OmpR family regulator
MGGGVDQHVGEMVERLGTLSAEVAVWRSLHPGLTAERARRRAQLGQILGVRPCEARLIETLMSRPDEGLNSGDLRAAVAPRRLDGSPGDPVTANSLKVYVSCARTALQAAGLAGTIDSIGYGQGYRMTAANAVRIETFLRCGAPR